MAENVSIGHGFAQQWSEPALRVVGAYKMVRKRSDEPPRRLIHPFWVISCRFGEAERYKIWNKKGEWNQNPSNFIALMPPRVPYWQDFSRLRSPMRAAFITFMGGESAGLSRFFQGRKKPVRFLDAQGLFRTIIDEAVAIAAKEREQGFLKVQAALYTLVDKLSSAVPADNPADAWTFPADVSTKSQQSFQNALVSYLNNRLQESVTVKEIADYFNLSIPGLFKRCRTEGVGSPAKVLNTLRCAQARVLLMQGEPLKSIAWKTGFWDACHLSKAFKRETGQSPRQYLRTLA